MPASQITSVTITFTVTPDQAAAYAQAYGPNAGFGEMRGHLRAVTEHALAGSYLVRGFTSYSVSEPA